jgi:glycosyltransferase involved in cell wall biosynthesis
MMTVSVCITTFNEEGSIAELLDSLLEQSRKPDEIIIVDGGSKDKTVEIIRHYQKKDKRIKLLEEIGYIAHGRNTSIDIARGEIIALTDAGCVAKKDWLEKITYPFKYKSVCLVAGFYEMPTEKPLNQAVSVFHGVPPARFDPQNFLPSARSVAFRKQLWSEIGGFDENLDKAGEDTKFFYEVVKRRVKIMRVKEARVVWQEIANISFQHSLKKFYFYAKGDSQAGIWWHPSKQLASHNLKVSFIFLRYIFGFVLLIYSIKSPIVFYILLMVIIGYIFWSIIKWSDVIKDWKAKVWLPIIQISSDLAVMVGFISGLIKKKAT